MKKIYHLANCSTCIRIIKELNPNSDVVMQDIKTDKITESQIDEMMKLSGSYESLQKLAFLSASSLLFSALQVQLLSMRTNGSLSIMAGSI